MGKFKVGEIAIALSDVQERNGRECEIIRVLPDGVYIILVPSYDNKKIFRTLEKYLRKKNKKPDDKDITTTWKHVQDTCAGFQPKFLIQQKRKENV